MNTHDRIQKNKDFLRNLYRGGPFERHAFCCSPPGPIFDPPSSRFFNLSDRPISEWVGPLAADYERQVAFLEATGHDDVPHITLSTGTEIYACAFGCPLHTYDDSPPCALPLLDTAEAADKLAEPDLWSQVPLMRIFELGQALRREVGPVAFAPCDMQSGFDIAAQIWEKSSLLTAMGGEPGEQAAVKNLTEKCGRFLRSFIAELRREFPTMGPCHCPGVWAPPEMGAWVSNDECGIVSTEMFEEFMLPDLVALSKEFGGIGMHCCAAAEHQFDSFKKIPGFYGFNRVPAAGKGLGFAPAVRALGGPNGPVFVLAWLGDNGIQECLDAAPPGSRFIFVNNGSTIDEARQWLDRARSLTAAAGTSNP